jgi:hypothetical protein
VGRAARRPEPTIDAQHLQALAGQAAAHESAQELLPLGAALGRGETKVDDLLLAVGAQPQRDQHRPCERAGAGLALEHHAIEHQHAVLILEGAAMEGGDGGIELPGHGAHRGGTDRAAEDRQERDRHLAGREAEQEAGEDHAIDVLGPPRIGPHHLEGAEGPGARHRQLKIAELGQQPAAIAAVAAIGPAKLGHALEVLVEQLVHAAFEQLGERVPGGGPVILAPFRALGLHRLHHRECCW